jgi:Outer membrane protein and related peptidoglycan-associated (lipo)proteins
VEAGLDQTNARVDGVIDRLDHLRLEKRLVLNLKEGTSFGFDSDALTDETENQINGFLSDLEGTDDKIFLVAGHTDSVGSERYNYELGQRRAAGVARYLTARGIDPIRVTTASYGETAPLADNTTRAGRHANRRIEVLVYREAITSSPGESAQRADVR